MQNHCYNSEVSVVLSRPVTSEDIIDLDPIIPKFGNSVALAQSICSMYKAYVNRKTMPIIFKIKMYKVKTTKEAFMAVVQHEVEQKVSIRPIMVKDGEWSIQERI